MDTTLTPRHGQKAERAAREFVIDKLKDCKKRLDGDLACNHAIRVSETLEGMGYGEDIVIAALLHDVVEDTATTEKGSKKEVKDPSL
ncbi:MAG: hypothetical protein Greene041619_559 [Candidatus Peregrinibacteria bacterium Greene0416_19]|nr:MAG: hypothetical protein Greene041619_559 [Candidatus Peregrinibacteria bacterium Greene0416_19]